MKYVLDTSAIIRNPEILSKASGVELHIPAAVIREISTFQNNQKLINFLNEAIKSGAFIEDDSLDFHSSSPYGEILKAKLNEADFAVSRVASKLASRHGEANLKVITYDRHLSKYLQSSKILTIDGDDFLEETRDQPTNLEAKDQARRYHFDQWAGILSSFIIGSLFSLLARQLYVNADAVLSSAPALGAALAVLFAGTFLFWIRENFRLTYGFTEFAVGMMMAYYVFSPVVENGVIDAASSLQVLAGLYVMVRGLDNIGKGLEGRSAEYLWKRIFYWKGHS